MLPIKSKREQTLDRLKKELFDLLVIGGGATGAGVALDAANRGLSVALVEQGDFGSGTSSKSTKLAHGGIRYLEKALLNLNFRQYGLVKEALHERENLFKMAPHLVKPLEIIIPIYKRWQIPYYFAGLKLYEWVAGQTFLPKSRYISTSEIEKEIPQIQKAGLSGGLTYFDGQFNDARLNLSLILTAATLNAAPLNYAELEHFTFNQGQITGGHIKDSLTGERFLVRANNVINAAGPFVDLIRQMDNPNAIPLIAPSSGTHILLDQSLKTGLLIPKTKDGRVIFVLPWEGSVMVGTTDNPTVVQKNPYPEKKEILYLLEHLKPYFIEKVSIKSAWTGIRPLLRDLPNAPTANLVRDHLIEKAPSGLITIAGGKWTTFRKMAQDAVDQISKKPSTTANIQLIGACHDVSGLTAALRQKYYISEKIADHLISSYGTFSEDILKEDMNTTLVENYPMIVSEIPWALKNEMGIKPMDLLARRMPLAALDADSAKKALPKVVELMSKHFNWSSSQADHEEKMALDELDRMKP